MMKFSKTKPRTFSQLLNSKRLMNSQSERLRGGDGLETFPWIDKPGGGMTYGIPRPGSYTLYFSRNTTMQKQQNLQNVRKALSMSTIEPATAARILGGGRQAHQYPRIPTPFVVDTDRPG